jgi:hypothetical protein
MEGSLVAYKVFTNGSTLQASELNENLMQQSVATFSNSAARTAAITAPVEGQMTYLIDSDDYESWDGTSWVPALSIGTWKSYTPTFSNFTLGNGTITVAKFTQIGKTVHLQVKVTLGSTSSVGTQPTISLPVTGKTNYQDSASGVCTLTAGAVNGIGYVYNISSTSCRMFATGAAGAYSIIAGVTATVPGTWTTGNSFGLSITYEAA